MCRIFIKKKGFTLIEIAVVISILAILATFAVANIFNLKNDTQDSAITTDMATLQNIFSVSSINNGNMGKDSIASGTIINVLSDINKDSVDPNILKLYSINYDIAKYYKKLNKNLDDYLVDDSNNVYYKGLFNSVFERLTEEDLENDIGTTVAEKTITGDAITNRYRHTAVRYNNKMIIFGGSDGSARKNDCYEVDLNSYISTKKTLAGDTISGRVLHSAVIYNGKMIIFGGYDGNYKNDCYEVDLKTYDVTQKTLTGDTISARYAHTAVVYDGKMIVFGGYAEGGLNDCYEVDLNSYIVTKKTLAGSAISARYYHTAVGFDGKMFIFGGYNYYAGFLGDCYSVDLSTYQVTKKTITGDSISARHMHTAGVYNGKMIVFGGAPLTNTCYSVNLSTSVSEKLNLDVSPSARYSHTAIMYFNKMIIFGGYNGTTLFNECYEVQ